MSQEKKEDEMQSSIPSGKVARTTVAGVTAAKIGTKKLQLMSKRPFLSKKSFEEHKAKNEDEIARTLFDGLTKLRGSALKIAQILSLELGVLPEAYRKELYKSHYQVPPLNRALIRKLMMSEFGKAPEEVFETFTPEAFAAASLGQVHEAYAKSGEKLAVKVQYPGIGPALKSDFQMVKQFMLPFVKTEFIARALAEIETRLTEEIDYDLERANTEWFHKNASGSKVISPKVYGEYCSKHVLATQFIDGVHLDRWLRQNPSQEKRDQAAQVIYDYLMHCCFDLHRMHADPNPGNYLFCEDGKIAVVDFGSVKIFEKEFCENLSKLWRSHIRNDFDKNIELYCWFGLGKGEKKKAEEFYIKHLKPFGQWIAEPFQTDIFDFGKNPEFCIQGAKFISGVATMEEMDGFTTGTIIFDRNLYGLFRMFTEMKARVRMKNKWIY
jgi:predicted unusual protein kinase regulating ubiquinone biosynthesis (AarF/ABC1/UbiB family)